MMPEPFKSALSLGDVEDTSLAVPSNPNHRSAQARVLEQVYTIRRSKSKYSSRSLSGPTSPTSPDSDSVFHEFKRSSASALSGPNMNRGSTMTNGAKQRQTTVRKSMNSRHSTAQQSSSSRNDRSVYATVNSLPTRPRPNSLYSLPTTQSAPDMGFNLNANSSTAQQGLIEKIYYPPIFNGNTAQRGQTFRHSLHERGHYFPAQNGTSQSNANGTVIRNTSNVQYFNRDGTIKRRASSLQSNGESMGRVGLTAASGVTTERLLSDMTMKEAVECLYSPDENYQLRGAAYIQHSTFTDDKAKQEVLTLKAIPTLINLLNSPSPQIQETVAAALRNAVFKNQPNKEEVQRSGGITQAVQLLGETNAETQKHLTGFLWNLSSSDNLKPDLLRTALPVLTEKVIEPFSSSTDNSTNTSVAPDVFTNATACLRNLSSSKLTNRQTMRNSKGLIDSLMRYSESCVTAETPDNPSLENCVCILHNLTYQLETEMPILFSKINALASYERKRTSSSDAGPIGCFSSQSQKLQQESGFDYPVVEDNNPKGAGWLFHSRALQMYLNLLSSSERPATLEACCGALQNLTANDGIVSNVLSNTIVQKLNGMKVISPLLESSNPALQSSAVALVGNLSRSTRTNKAMARQGLPQLLGFLNSGMASSDTSPKFDSSMATALHSAHTLLKADPEMGKGLLNSGLIKNLNRMSYNTGLPKSSSAAGVLLHSLWSDKNIQSFLKRQGMSKKEFVNDITSAAFKSLQVID